MRLASKYEVIIGTMYVGIISLCYCTAELLPSIVVCLVYKRHFRRNGPVDTPNVAESTNIPRPFFFKLFFFYFVLDFILRFPQYLIIQEENFQTTPPLKLHSRYAPTNSRMSLPNLSNLHLKTTRYFTSVACPLRMKFNCVPGQVVKHHRQSDKAHGHLVCPFRLFKSIRN